MIREESAPEFQLLIDQLGLGNLRGLLDARSPAARLPGVWESLSKPGLRGRERYRWRLGADGLAGKSDPARTYFVKRYLTTGWREQLDRLWRQLFGHSRAWWEFRQSRVLAEKYVPAVRAVGVIENMSGPYEVASAAVFEAAPGDALNRVWAAGVARGTAFVRPPLRHDLVRRLGRFISAFHQTGYCHRDLYLAHVFVQVDDDMTQPPRLTLIDLARTHRPMFRKMRWIIKDLAQLDFSATEIGATRADRVRFLQAYLGLQHRAPRVRYYARRIGRKSASIGNRELRKRNTR